MDEQQNFPQIYNENEIIFNSTSDEEAKSSAWRQQGILLANVSKNSCQSVQKTILKNHFIKYKDGYVDFIDRRANAVSELLKGFPIEKFQKEFDYVKEYEELDYSNVDSFKNQNNICNHDKVTQKSLNELMSKSNNHSQSNNVQKRDISSFFQRRTGSETSTECKYRNEVNAILTKSNFSSSEKPNNSCLSTTETESFAASDYRTAGEELIRRNLKKYGNSKVSNIKPLPSYGASKKTLGLRRTVPIRQENVVDSKSTNDDVCDERLVNIDSKMIEFITNEIMHIHKSIDWSDIAGLEYAKSTIKEAVVWPLLRPDIFNGLRRPPRGILLFGPPGTGKTLIGKCIASQSKSTFFSISASSLTSKWIGEGEKMVRALFAVAAVRQPSVVFIDEIDSLLSQRSDTEHESSRRLKTEFLVQLDGAATSEDDRILIVGATNRPQELDEAARRRLVRRLYIPLPELDARIQIITNLLKSMPNSIDKEQLHMIGNLTDGYSGADMETLCREASMEPIRSIPSDKIPFFNKDDLRPVNADDFRSALERVRASVSAQDLQQYIEWDRTFGAGQ